MTSHGYIGGRRRSNEVDITKEVFRVAGEVHARGIEITYFPITEGRGLINMIVEFDCHDKDGKANPDRVEAFGNKLNDTGDVIGVDWTYPVILEPVSISAKLKWRK